MRKDRKKGMIMAYTDRPGTQFWADYLPRSEEQDEAEKWSKNKSNPRLVSKFEQYLLENKVRNFKRENLLAYGIRDWSRDPYGAACHAWRPGRKSWEVIGRLKAFPLAKRRLRNVHVCGEAYSDYQGFIEGALRSAASVLEVLNVGAVANR
jgi:monoamine oxidase